METLIFISNDPISPNVGEERNPALIKSAKQIYLLAIGEKKRHNYEDALIN